MIAKVPRMFQRHDPRREATLALARIKTLAGIDSLPWDSGVYEDRRSKDEVHHALGMWLVPISTNQDLDDVAFSDAKQAVCYDLRAEGFGVLTPDLLESQTFIVAIPNGTDCDDSWKFFIATCCHHTCRPGGWFLLGLLAERIYEPIALQTQQFRALTAAALATTESE